MHVYTANYIMHVVLHVLHVHAVHDAKVGGREDVAHACNFTRECYTVQMGAHTEGKLQPRREGNQHTIPLPIIQYACNMCMGIYCVCVCMP